MYHSSCVGVSLYLDLCFPVLSKALLTSLENLREVCASVTVIPLVRLCYTTSNMTNFSSKALLQLPFKAEVLSLLG